MSGPWRNVMVKQLQDRVINQIVRAETEPRTWNERLLSWPWRPWRSWKFVRRPPGEARDKVRILCREWPDAQKAPRRACDDAGCGVTPACRSGGRGVSGLASNGI
jgi:hypothetical protein